MSLYPFLFAPRYVEKMWGGRKLQTILRKEIPADKPIGESWELYDFPPGVIDGETGWTSASLTNGPLAGKTLHELVEHFGPELCGDVALVGPHGQFPILIKFLDAQQDLSVQVHPPESYAATHPGAHLKNEAWYVMQNDINARILKGLQPDTTREQFAKSIENGTCEQLLATLPVKPGDVHYLPSGTVHALGAGILAAEVQTPSDTTYRVYDFDRVDPSTGQKRKLHVEQALDCIDFSNPAPPPAPAKSHAASFFTTVSRIVEAPQFVVEKVRMSEGFEQPLPYDQPVVWMMLEGTAEVRVTGLVDPVRFGKGQTVLLPARMNNPILETHSDCVWLEVTFPPAP